MYNTGMGLEEGIRLWIDDHRRLAYAVIVASLVVGGEVIHQTVTVPHMHSHEGREKRTDPKPQPTPMPEDQPLTLYYAVTNPEGGNFQ